MASPSSASSVGAAATGGSESCDATSVAGRLPIGSKASSGPSGESGSPRQRATVKLPARSPVRRAAQLASIIDEASRNSVGSGATWPITTCSGALITTSPPALPPEASSTVSPERMKAWLAISMRPP
jgi:hypothetical protein